MWANHAYTQQLAAFIEEHWLDECDPSANSSLPVFPVLEALISTAYQASLLREEEVPLTFRLILADASSFPSASGPPEGLHRLVFDELIPYSPHELKPLVFAANFHRSLIGLKLESEGAAFIWGIVHSGPRWLHAVHGGRGSAPLMPDALVINVTGPGCIEVCRGSTPIGQLSLGRVFGPSLNVLQAPWLQDIFAQTRAERRELHTAALNNSKECWAELEPELTHIVDQNMVKRVLAAIRGFKHGGTLIMVPTDMATTLLAPNPYVNIRYRFAEGEPRARFRTLIVAVMNALAAGAGNSGTPPKAVGWQQYQESTDPRIAALDEAIFEMSHLIAALSTVDGAVVMTRRFELLGFGTEIRCNLDELSRVAKSLDIDGMRFKLENLRGAGNRHRSAYNLCQSLRETLVIVISQDGGIRFIRWHRDQVMYWDHQATFAFSERF